MHKRVLMFVSLIALAALAGIGVAVARLPRGERVLGSYGTPLDGRTRSQAFNAMRAAQALDGRTLRPGEIFSFNKRVGPWNAEAGYRRAPVSYDGELVKSFGGGVCQTSTTLYNAALLAGLDVVERHRHIRPPVYVVPGRDAAVAMPSIDLRLRNPYPFPVRLETRTVGDSLVIAVMGRGPRRAIAVRTEVESVQAPTLVRRTGVVNHGQPGFTAVTSVSTEAARGRVVARDNYAPVSRLKP